MPKYLVEQGSHRRLQRKLSIEEFETEEDRTAWLLKTPNILSCERLSDDIETDPQVVDVIAKLSNGGLAVHYSTSGPIAYTKK